MAGSPVVTDLGALVKSLVVSTLAISTSLNLQAFVDVCTRAILPLQGHEFKSGWISVLVKFLVMLLFLAALIAAIVLLS